MRKTKIIVAGIGGVGGYFGGLLAKHYVEDTNVEINFLARGKHLNEIQKNGLKVIVGKDYFIAKPKLSTDKPIEIGIADLIIICTKSYDLEQVLQQLQPCINHHTIILPLLNGVDNKEKIQTYFPNNIVLEGCVYLVSKLKQEGIIENTGNIQTLYFGIESCVNNKLKEIEWLFKKANIEASLAQNISTVIWEKFIFLSPIATATTYYNNCIGELLVDNKKIKTVTALIEEVKQIAKAKQIAISDNITAITLAKLKALPFESTASMHIDFQSKKPFNELESLTAYTIKEGLKYGIETPTFIQTYTELKKRNAL